MASMTNNERAAYLRQYALDRTESIKILSGEGEGEGTLEIYTGKRTVRAIRARLTRERKSQRWAVLVLDGERIPEF